jgi:hypothetical protein
MYYVASGNSHEPQTSEISIRSSGRTPMNTSTGYQSGLFPLAD